MFRAMLLGLSACTCVGTAAAAASLEAEHVYKGTCEPSGAVAIYTESAPARLLVAEDEHNTILDYPMDVGSRPITMGGFNLNEFGGFLDREDDDGSDLEAATWLGDRVVWISSHSRNKDIEPKKHRQHLFSTMISTEHGQVKMVPSPQRSYGGLLNDMESLEIASLTDAIGAKSDRDPDLHPEAKGLNIEGLAADPDGRSLLIGFRNPLTEDGKAIVLRLTNPHTVLDEGKPAEFDGESPIALDLGGRGIRSMEYAPATGRYYIAAGPTGSDGTAELFTWSGKADEAPEVVPGAAAIIDGPYMPEAMVVEPDGKRLHLLIDEGDRPVTSAACAEALTNGACRCQDLKNPAGMSFTSFVIKLD